MNDARPSEDPIAAGRTVCLRHKRLLFRTLALLWILPSLGAGFILAESAAPVRAARSVAETLARVAFEQWIALAVLLAHGLFLWLAWHYRRPDPLREHERGGGD